MASEYNNKNKKDQNFRLPFIIVFLFVISPFIILKINININGKKIIGEASHKLVAEDYSDNITLLNNIADYIKKTIIYKTGDVKFFGFFCYYYPFKPFIVLRPNNPTPESIIILQKGACEERAVLLKGITENMGYETRIIKNPGEDHVWNEIKINGTWCQFDVATKSFNDSNSYERSRDMGGWGKQLSTVLYYDGEGHRQYCTKKYTKIGNLLVSVTKNGVPIRNLKVKILSRYLMESDQWGSFYSSPLLAVYNSTSENGNCSFELGQNNYVVEASITKWLFFREKKEIDISIMEGEEFYIHIDF